MVQLGDALIRLEALPIKLLDNYMSNPAAVARWKKRIWMGFLPRRKHLPHNFREALLTALG
jgi:hypothetical protein